MQPFPIASLQAEIIDHDVDRMSELLEGFAWEYEKVCQAAAFVTWHSALITRNTEEHRQTHALHLFVVSAVCGGAVLLLILLNGAQCVVNLENNMHTSLNMFAQTALQFIGGLLLYAGPMCIWHRSEMLPACVLITDMPLLMQKWLIPAAPADAELLALTM